MSATVANARRVELLNNLDVRPTQAKVHTVSHKKVANAAERTEAARLMNRAREISGFTADRFAREVGMDASQFSKQIANVEPPQLLRVLFSPMRPHLVQAMAEGTPGVRVQAVITIERSA